MELCSLKAFKKGLKGNKYQEAFFCFQRALSNGCDDVCYFTHRTAHGTWGSGDKPLGDHAKETLEALKRDFPTVFAKPTFPVQRPAD